MADAAVPLRAPAVLLGVLLLFTYGYFVSPPSWNENSRFDLTRSIVERGRLDIDPYHHNTGDKSFRDGHHYSDKAPGASFLALAPYAAYYGYLRLSGGSLPHSVAAETGSVDADTEYFVNLGFRRALYLCSVATSGAAGALLGVLFFLHLCARAVPPRAAFAAAIALSLGSLVLPYATMFYGHVIAAAFLFGSYFVLARPHEPGARGLALAGALAGCAVLTELPAAGAFAALAAFALWRSSPRARALWFVAGAAAPLAMLLAYQFTAFGSPFRAGYALVSRPEFAEGMSRGVMGVGLPRPGVLLALLFGRARGLFYVAPVLALALGGLVSTLIVRARRGPEPLLAAVIVLFFLLLNAGYYMWHGGSALGPRHLIPALPFLCLGLPAVLRGRWRVPFAILLAISVVNELVATAVEPAAPFVRDVLRDHVYANFLAGEVGLAEGATNLGAIIGLAGPFTLVPLLGIWALALRVLWPLLPRDAVEGIITAANRGDDRSSAPATL